MQKVTIIVNSDIGENGTIGNRAFEIAKELKLNNQLNKIICRKNYIKEFNNFSIEIIPFNNLIPKIMVSINYYLLPKFQTYIYNLKIFDYFLTQHLNKNIQNYENDIILTFEPCIKSLLKFKKNKIILDIQMSNWQTINLELIKKGFKEDYLIYSKKFLQKINKKTKYDLIYFKKKQISKISPYSYLKIAIKLSDLIIFPSENTKNSFKRETKNKKNKVIPFGVNLNKTKTKIKTKKIIFSFLGAVEERKGINHLIKVWNELNLKDSELLICGRISKKYFRYKNNNNLKFLGFQNSFEILSKTEIFIFPTLLEGSAKCIYEAMASKTAIITTNQSGSIIENNKDGIIININNVNQFQSELKEKILYLYKNKKIREKYKKNAYKKIQKYTWHNYAKNIINTLYSTK